MMFALMFAGYFVGRLALEMSKSKEGTIEGTAAGIAVYICIVAILYGLVGIFASNYRPGVNMGGLPETVLNPPPVDLGQPDERTTTPAR